MKVDELDYELPRELIASTPPPERDGARMMVLSRSDGTIAHDRVRQLAERIPRGALVVVNDTKVINARIRGAKPTGGAVELFLLRPIDANARRWTAFGRASKPIRPGLLVKASETLSLRVVDKDANGVLEVELDCDEPWSAIEANGEVPLPPYMERAPTDEDRARYQCVFAEKPGAVAAPTAGLHLSERVLEDFAARSIERIAVTLHVGAGTFQPVSVDDLDKHVMHREWYEVPAIAQEKITLAKREGRPVVAIGTTVVRTLESWALGANPSTGDTALLIQPGYAFRVVDHLLTNFHLPRSTLLALVMAFAGTDFARRAYEEAVRERYRFFSYGDAMFIA
ncbi:MAG: tRNA preQ1(34) S-adenosylmethionine ribosyltransferase-isomerase QueA [Myxococcales bacterium]|nr:tRNA preQ1(34) S-adenosylmethionine ribosyltransferase-isomerase QueA [Myxococcales bacterium]